MKVCKLTHQPAGMLWQPNPPWRLHQQLSTECAPSGPGQPERLKTVMDYLNIHTYLSTSDVIEFLIYQPGFLDEESVENNKQLLM